MTPLLSVIRTSIDSLLSKGRRLRLTHLIRRCLSVEALEARDCPAGIAAEMDVAAVIKNQQLQNGAIVYYLRTWQNDTQPNIADVYFSGTAMYWWLKAPPVSNVDRLDVTRRWLEWNFNSNVDANGHFMRQFLLNDGTRQPPPRPQDGEADADDSASAIFLAVLDEYVKLGGSTAFIDSPSGKAKIETIANVMLNLQQPNGLTIGKTSYPVSDTEDNCEVFVGFQAAASLERFHFQDLAAAQPYAAAASRVQSAIVNLLYNQQSGLFDWALNTPSNLRASYYPDTLTQFWPTIYGVVAANSPIALSVMSKVNTVWTGNQNRDNNWETRLDGASAAVAALMTGDNARPLNALANLASAPYPPIDYPKYVTTVADWGFTMSLYTLLLPKAAVASAPEVTDATTPGNYQFTVRYDDDNAIDLVSLRSTNVYVTGPNGFGQLARLDAVDVASNGSPRTATYSIVPPGGSFNNFEDGTYSILARRGEVADVDGYLLPEQRLGSFEVAVTAPRVSAASIPNVDGTRPRGAHRFSITFSDPDGIDLVSLRSTNVFVIGPNNFGQFARLADVDLRSNGTSRTATYEISPPGGAFSEAGQGTYTVVLVAGQVADVRGNMLGETVLGHFEVVLDRTPPTARLAYAPAVTPSNTGDYFFTVQYFDDRALDRESLVRSQVYVSGPLGFARNAQAVDVDVTADGTFASVRYRLASPGPAFDRGENGRYALTLNSRQAFDLSGNAALDAALGSFDVFV